MMVINGNVVKTMPLNNKHINMLMGKSLVNGPLSIATVDGRNPAPVDRWFVPLFIGFQPSKVMQDFFHPQ